MMEPPSESVKTKISKDTVPDLEIHEHLEKTNNKTMIDSELQKSVLKKSNATNSGSNVFKILPKGAIPLKTIQGPNGNLYVQGPQKKLLSLKIKGPAITTNITKNSCSTPAVSFLPITLSKDVKVFKSCTLDSKHNSSETTTAPLTISKIAKNLSLPFQSKTFTSKSDSTEFHSVTIEKRKVKSIDTNVPRHMYMNVNQNLIENATKIMEEEIPAIENKTDTSDHNDENGNIELNTSLKNDESDVEAVKSETEVEIKLLQPNLDGEDNVDPLAITENPESFVKNKNLENLKCSPRTKARSKSLTSLRRTKVYGNFSKKRRGSAASENDTRKLKSNIRLSSMLSKDKTLLCLEQMDKVSPESKSSEPTLDPLANDFSSDKSEFIVKIDPDLNVNKKIHDEYQNAKKCLGLKEQLENLQTIDWNSGIGTLKNSSLCFQYNEFGLIEVLDPKKTEIYAKPIYEREFKSQKTSDYSDPLYLCKACNCRGAAIDFLMPEFCSHACIKRFNLRDQTTKQYTNKKKLIAQSLKNKLEYPERNRETIVFDWNMYLRAKKAERAPIHLFLNPFPSGANSFRLGMRLEAIDPENSSVFAVCTIIETKGYRLKLHFDGYSSIHDFWVNADSMDIFPPGWCAKTNRKLQPPKGIIPSEFNWPTYFSHTRSAPATRELFTHLNSSSHANPFRVGMKLEADDLRNTGKVCVATVADVLDNRILVHFDGWADKYDYWINITSPYIHPADWHRTNGFSIVPPPDFRGNFSWTDYLFMTKSLPASENMFSTRDPIDFKSGMKLEVVDKKNPSLIRPATIVMTDEYEIKVLFDGWGNEFAFWVEDDSQDIHPVGWCQMTNHELEPPPDYNSLPILVACPIPGCRGVGNTKYSELKTHNDLSACPYEVNNWTKEAQKPDRLIEYKAFLSGLKQRDTNQRNKRKAVSLDNKLDTKIKNIKMFTESEDSMLDMRINISKSLLCDYGPRLKESYSLWKRNSECLVKNLPEKVRKNPLEWTVEEVAGYVEKIPQCQIIAQDFRQEEIDGAAFLSLRQTDLTDLMKMKVGPAVKIYNQIVQLREEAAVRFFGY